jgi:S-adenosyl-L-methionine hydrolase (adenosine-forming)
MSFAPNGLVTLTTDFGLDDPFAGIVKGRILGRFPDARIVDLSHGIPPGRADLAGFWLARSWREFPAGTSHLAVVDPGVGTARRVLLALAGGHLLLAPDNGLLPEALRDQPGVQWLAMDTGLPEQLALGTLSNTFHGRDLFAPLVGALACGALHPRQFGQPAEPADPRPLPSARATADGLEGEVLLADRFGNLITNIEASRVTRWLQPVVHAGGSAFPLRRTYAEAPPGTPLAIVNSFGLLEIAVNRGDAAVILGLGEHAPVRVTEGLSA